MCTSIYSEVLNKNPLDYEAHIDNKRFLIDAGRPCGFMFSNVWAADKRKKLYVIERSTVWLWVPRRCTSKGFTQ